MCKFHVDFVFHCLKWLELNKSYQNMFIIWVFIFCIISYNFVQHIMYILYPIYVI
jgi:hypothetical protein